MPIKICIHHMATQNCWEQEGQHRELSFETKPPVPTTQDLIRWQCCRTLAYNKFYATLQGIPNCQTHVGYRQMPHTIAVYKPACILSNNSARFGTGHKIVYIHCSVDAYVWRYSHPWMKTRRTGVSGYPPHSGVDLGEVRGHKGGHLSELLHSPPLKMHQALCAIYLAGSLALTLEWTATPAACRYTQCTH